MRLRKSIFIYSCIAVFLFSLIQACKHEPLIVPQHSESSANGGNPITGGKVGPIYGSSGDTLKDSICFNEDVLPLILSNCSKSGCHDGKSWNIPNLTNFSQILNFVLPGKPSQSKLYNDITAIFSGRMPPMPNNPLTQVQINLIKEWILEGAKNNIDCGMSCDTAVFTFSGEVNITFQNYCLGCHNGGTSGGGISLIGYNNVAAQVNNGKLWGSINHFNGFYPMPTVGPMLDNCRLTTIKKWISAGAPDN